LQRDYPNLKISVPDNQGDLIQLSVSNMQNALRDAIVMTVLVIFLFLADIPMMVLAAISIPFTYLLTFAVMWLLGYEFNIVTLTAVIVAVGMLLDDAIVVLENIERHYNSLGESVHDSAVGGTEEVMLAIFSGTYATLMVLLPIIFIGGYVQTVLRPMAVTLSIALLASYVVSITIIPLLAPSLLRASHGRKRNLVERTAKLFDTYIVSPMRDGYVGIVKSAIQRPWLFIPPAMIALVLSLRQLPVIGRDLMPPMDTGIIKISVQMYPNTSLGATSTAVMRMEQLIKAHPEVTTISATIGTEPAVISFGSGRTAQQCDMTVHLTDRFHRQATIWQIENSIRKQLRSLPGVQYADVFDYGATPISTVWAPFDVMISGPDLSVLQTLGDQVATRLSTKVHGLTSVRLSWNLQSREFLFHLIPERAGQFGISPAILAAQIQGGLRGIPASTYRVAGQDGLPLWIQFPGTNRNNISDIMDYRVQTAYGAIPLASFGTVSSEYAPTVITRQGLQRTIDVKGYRARTPITQLQSQIESALAPINLPKGYTISYEGEDKLMTSSFVRLMSALGLGVVLLYFSLVPAFKSWIHPLTIMIAIPFGIIGAAWGLMIAGLHSSMPSMMGMILLAGIVVKNSILLVDFIEEARARGESLDDALLGSVRVRTRPILMTAVGTSIGMLPVALGWAIGLERLAGLGTVAIAGLMVSTLFTLGYVPLFYKLLDGVTTRIRRIAASRYPAVRAEEAPSQVH
jgi:multidrug efflux pump subunit AcrB